MITPKHRPEWLVRSTARSIHSSTNRRFSSPVNGSRRACRRSVSRSARLASASAACSPTAEDRLLFAAVNRPEPAGATRYCSVIAQVQQTTGLAVRRPRYTDGATVVLQLMPTGQGGV